MIFFDSPNIARVMTGFGMTGTFLWVGDHKGRPYIHLTGS
jgi:hypothetical protein